MNLGPNQSAHTLRGLFGDGCPLDVQSKCILAESAKFTCRGAFDDMSVSVRLLDAVDILTCVGTTITLDLNRAKYDVQSPSIISLFTYMSTRTSI